MGPEGTPIGTPASAGDASYSLPLDKPEKETDSQERDLTGTEMFLEIKKLITEF